MNISPEQARIAARYAGPHCETPVATHPDISDELMKRIALALAEAPETNTERVCRAKEKVEAGVFDSDEIAQMIIARAICDALH